MSGAETLDGLGGVGVGVNAESALEGLAGAANGVPVVIRFTVLGEARPAGSKRAFKHPSTGAIVVTDANPRAKGWKQEVKQAALDSLGPITGGSVRDLPVFGAGALGVRFDFYRPRPKGHFGSGRNAGVLKASAPRAPATRPDLLKLARGVEDALTGICWRDDAQIVDEVLGKHWGAARVEVSVWRLP